jgi:hypothetical protein
VGSHDKLYVCESLAVGVARADAAIATRVSYSSHVKGDCGAVVNEPCCLFQVDFGRHK